MSELERALRGAFAMDAVPEPRPGFEARVAGAARQRRVLPGLLATAVAAAAIATLLVGRRGEERAARGARPLRAGGGSVTEVWQLVVELRHRFSWSTADEEKPEPVPITAPQPPTPTEPREHRPAVRRPIAGATPLEIDVIPGEHMFEVRWEDGRTKKVFATLRSGDHRSIRVSPR